MADDGNWLPHNLLADTYLRQHDYRKAREEAEVAIERAREPPILRNSFFGEALPAWDMIRRRFKP